MRTVISAFFLGTNCRMFQNGHVSGYTVAHHFRKFFDDDEYFSTDDEQNTTKQVCFFFDGCGVQDMEAEETAPRVLGIPFISGVPFGPEIFFGRGLDTQCQKVIERVLKELSLGNEVTLNMYGHSRGGLVALMTAKQLSYIDDSCLSINLALLDPVPGNLITTTYLDPLEISLTNKLEDLTACKPLKKVLSLYSGYFGKRLSNLGVMSLVYAPLFPSYPATTDVVEDILPLDHALLSAHLFSILRVSEFFFQNGVPCEHMWLGDRNMPLPHDLSNKNQVNAQYLQLYSLMHKERIGTREAHSEQGFCIKGKKTADGKMSCVNNHHRALLDGTIEADIRYSIALNTALIPSFKRLVAAYPVAWQILKWTCLGLGAASIIYLTGGFGAIPLMAPVLAKLAALIIVAAAPIVGTVLAGLWYGIVKPATLPIISRIVYPDYAMRSHPSGKSVPPDEALANNLQSAPFS